MRWHERHGHTIDVTLMALVALAMLTLFLLLVVLPLKSYGASCTSMSGIEPRYLTHQLDGDTIALFSIPHGHLKFRIKDVDTPERKQPGWSEARAFTWAWLHVGPFDLETCWKSTLDRYVAVVSRHGETLADALRKAGHIKP